MLNLADLPNDIDALKAFLWSREVEVAGSKAPLNTRAAEIEHLKLHIAKLRRMQFGRKSEKLDYQIEQLELQLEDLQADDAEAEREMPATDQAPRKRAARKPSPEHLLRDEQRHLPGNEACMSCGGKLHQLGEDVAEQLEFVPASLARDPSRAPETGLLLLRRHRAGAGPKPADCARHRRSRPAGACAGGQVRGSPAVVLVVRDLRT